MRFLPRRRLWRVVLALGVVIAGVAIAAVVIALNKPGNVSHPDLQFTTPTTKAAQKTTTKAPPKKAKKAGNSFVWPWYGLSAARTRQFVAPADLKPPLHVGWTYDGPALLEFPPSIDRNRMFFLDDAGTARALDVRTGKTLWSRQVGTLAAATPAIDPQDGLIFMPTLSDTGHSPGNGRFLALSLKTGKVKWSHALASGSESSPIVHDGVVYFGDNGGTLYALNARNGKTKWTFHAGGAIKGGPALWRGKLYFGDYGGQVYGVNASNGHQAWVTSTSGAHFGLGSGNFYATAAVAYGRVYIGNTDGRVYSFGARNGALAWATATGAFVYAAAAVADPKGVGPTVYVGSYDGQFYAFNAQSGAVRWKHPGGGRISGSATVVGNVVYFAGLDSRTTYGLNVKNGAQEFTYPDGAFTPVVADEHAIYLVGYGSINQLLPGAKAKPKPTHKGHAKRGRHAKAHAADRHHPKSHRAHRHHS
jgi:outer membrane protein assembly factor BamB